MDEQKTTKWPDLYVFGARLGFAVTETGRRLVLDVHDGQKIRESLSPRYITALSNLGFNPDEFRAETGLRMLASGSAFNLVDLQLLLPGFRPSAHLREMTREEVQVEYSEQPSSAQFEKKRTDPALEALGLEEKFVEYVLEEDEGHNEGYSIRESVLTIDAAIKAAGLKPVWTIKEEDDDVDQSIYEVACATFESAANDTIARVEISSDGKAIFFIGEERYRGDHYRATADDKSQQAAIKEMAEVISKPAPAAQETTPAVAWSDFTPNDFGYHSREVEGLKEGYFVAQWDKDSARIVEADRGDEKGLVRRLADGRWEFEGYWATEDDVSRFRGTGNIFDSPEEAVLHFNRYLAVLQEPWQATFAEYAAFGGRLEGGYRKVGDSHSKDYSMGHKEIVARALAEGKPVPPEVLAEYPGSADATPQKTNEKMTFNEWEGEVTRQIEEMFEVTTSDAQGIVEAQPFLMHQAWGEALSPAETAGRILKAAAALNTSPVDATLEDVINVIEKVRPFLSPGQVEIMGDATRGDDGQYFKNKFVELAGVIDSMPKTYETDGMGDKAVVYLHYFKGSSAWYITEKDVDNDGEGQIQAYGYAVLNGDLQSAENGYINIAELTRYGVEMDLHWTPKPLAQVKKDLYRSENSEERSLAQELELEPEDDTEEVDLALAALNATTGFAEFVMQYDKDHIEGYSPKKTILHIDECAKKAGLQVQWTEAEDGTAAGTFTSPDKNANQVAGAHVFGSAKAIFLLNGERFHDSHATSDPEALGVTINLLSRFILKSTKKNKEDLDPSNPEDYARIMKSETLQLYFQDFLDHFMIGRIIEIRNELRELGWDDDGSLPMRHGPLHKNGEQLVQSYKQVGAGENIVALFLNGEHDDLTKTPKEWAAKIDEAATRKKLELGSSESSAALGKEVDISDLKNIGLATITSVGSENIYFEKDGEAYFCKVTNTSVYELGEYDFSKKIGPEKDPAAATKKPRKVKSKVIGKINDVGEKIGGAKKDLAGRRVVLEDLAKMNDAEKDDLVIKDKIFPPFDYRKMRDDGVDPAVALILKLIRDRIPVRPSKVKGTVCRDFYVTSPSYSTKHGWGCGLGKCSAEDYAKNVAFIYERLASVSTVDELRLQCQKLRHFFEYANEDITSEDFFETKAGIRFIEARQLRDVVGDKVYYVFCVANRYIDQAIENTKKDGWAGVIRGNSGGRQKNETDTDILPQRPHLKSIVREGDDIRGGKNVSAESLRSETECRAIEFGNWLPQDERQSVLNHAYDAFQDLAEATGLPYTATSLDGTLAMAFGARGSGGKGAALAHYEPARSVINLTRLSGAGSLAHEWGHALDNFLGKSFGNGGYLSEGAQFQRTSEEAGELFLAISSLMKTIKAKDLTFGESMQRAEDKALLYADYAKSWALAWAYRGGFKDSDIAKEYRDEVVALIKDFKESIHPKGFTSEKTEELEALLESFEAIYKKKGGGRIKQKEWKAFSGCKNASVSQAQLAAGLRNRNPDSLNDMGHSQDTNFFASAKKLDSKRSKSYWATNVELFARAFECWVFDALAKKGIRSDYLVHGVEEMRFADGRFRGNPYPSGQERIEINKQMDRVMDTVKKYIHLLSDQEQHTPQAKAAPGF